MMDSTLFLYKHQLWLRFAFLSFATVDPKIKTRLYEFSQIEFRHLRWLAQTLYEQETAYDYHRSASFGIEFHHFHAGISSAVDEIRSLHTLYSDSPLCARMKNDEEYMISILDGYLENPSLQMPFSAFDKKREWPDAPLSAAQIDALTLFLFEESYKEYELIMIYFYRQIRSATPLQALHFQDLIDESHFHLRSFGEMMSLMGILSLPRELHPMTYQITDMEKFLIHGIAEEENAKEECRRLASSITDEKLSRFFDFINYQESYHIEIMKRLLKEETWKN